MNILNKILYLLKDKAFWINLIVFIFLMIVSGWILLMSLKLITKWGQSADVPNVINKNFEIATEKIEEVGLEWEIKDSVYRTDLPEGTIIDVQPAPGLNIKSGRTVFLIVATKTPPKVEMPALVGRSSLRFAQIELEARGLRIGSLSYVPSPDKDAVLSQRIGNTEIAAGTLIPKGTIINLTLGDGVSGAIMDVPYLIGMTKEEADSYLRENNLFANYFYNKDIEDTVSAVIFKQYPNPNGEEKLNMGEPLDLFFSKTLPKNILEDSTFKARRK
jgi:beta-lactam-binding protein with PASTA domain